MSTRIRVDETLRKQHSNLIAYLASKAITAKPTSFHRLLRALDSANTLIRVYSQNIDALESKVGFDLLDRSPTSRCITLHGSLANLRCKNCSAIKPLEEAFRLLKTGLLPDCLFTERALPNLRQRTRACGVLYPDVALYGEPVKDEEHIKSAVNFDLRKITKHTMLLAVGTSLKIPGVVEIVRTLGNAIASNGGKIVYMDMDPNVPDGLRRCFDIVLQMDCQVFARQVVDELKGKGIDELRADVELRKDMRPLWDWE